VAGLCLVLLAACGGDGSGASVPDATGADLEVTSSAFGDGDTIPAKFTCDGDDASPPIAWTPEGEGSFAIVLFDPDAPGDGFVHWVLYGVTGGVGENTTEGSVATNDFGDRGYGGPCPPPGDQPHHYEFTVYELQSDFNMPPGELSAADALQAIDGHTEASGTLTGLYGR
jgi:Raf kinase inhibitor-like YbhB/YbcL family protein